MNISFNLGRLNSMICLARAQVYSYYKQRRINNIIVKKGKKKKRNTLGVNVVQFYLAVKTS